MLHFDISWQEYTTSLAQLISWITDINSIKVHIDFWADHEQSKILRDFVGYIFDQHDIHVPWRGRFILITDELINNAIEHGSREGDIDSCLIEAGKRGDEFYIVLEVHDTGNGKDAKDATHMEQIKHEKLSHNGKTYMEKRGRGLFHITEKLVDRLAFSQSPRGGLAVKIEKRIPPEEYLDSFEKSVS